MTPKLQNRGITLTTRPPEVPTIQTRGRTSRRPLLSQLPQTNVLRVSTSAINANGVVGSGAAWYGLARWKCPESIGQVAVWAGYRVILQPTDPSGGVLTAAPPRAWGSAYTTGEGACIVIGRNLPFNTVKTWQAGPITPFVAPATPGPVGAAAPEQAMYFPFPPGILGADYVQSIQINQTSPFGAILSDGTLDVAFVCDRSYLGVGYFNMQVHVELLLGTDQNRGELSE